MSRRQPEEMPPEKVDAVVCAVCKMIPSINEGLPEEFRPAHVTVALVDAVFNPRLRYIETVVPIVEGYCRYFKLKRTVSPECWPPPRESQQKLKTLLDQYRGPGKKKMRTCVFGKNFRSPGTMVYKSDNVLECAKALHDLCIDTIDDVRAKTPKSVKKALTGVKGIGPATAHMFLMYCGRDDYVKGDVHVCQFVAEALDDEKVRPCDAEELVAAAACRLNVTPRALDAAIWTLGARGKQGQ